MCEIFFSLKPGGNLGKEDLRRQFLVMEGGAFMNKDGYGAFSPTDVLRSPEKFNASVVPYLVKRLYGGSFCVSHLRAATNGGVKKQNTHPFEGNRFILVHNGILYFDDLGNNESDSGHLLKKIDETQGTPVERIQKVLKETSGWLSVFLYDKETLKLYYFRNGANFTFGYIPAKKIIIGATAPRAFYSWFAKNEYGFSWKQYKIVKTTPEENVIYEIGNNGLQEVGKFEMKSLGYGKFKYNTGGKTDNGKITTTLWDDYEDAYTSQKKWESPFKFERK